MAGSRVISSLIVLCTFTALALWAPRDLYASGNGLVPAELSGFAPRILQQDSSESSSSTEATIGYAKRNGGEVSLEGKVVTAVFHDADGNVSFFYVQEPVIGGSGIKVVPEVPVPVTDGNTVTVSGRVVDGAASGECYIRASSVQSTGSALRPAPIGMNQRDMAAGQFGGQPALYHNTSDSLPGTELSPVGSRVRVWGQLLDNETADGHAVCYIDDGSCLTTSLHQGLKVVYWDSDDAPIGQSHVVLNGILGAELVDNEAVPIVRVPASCDVPSGNVKYVTPNGLPIGSWDDPFASIQDAIDAAAAESLNGEVWVAAGTYNQSIVLADGVAVYGGFAGGETLREQRNWTTNLTTINGTDWAVSILYCPSLDTRLDGFIVCGGTLSGVYCVLSHAVVANNTITDNSSNYGGGIYCSDSTALIWNNIITDNSAGPAAGGIASYGGSPLIAHNIITGNNTRSDGYGGGIYCDGSPTIRGNYISGNNSGIGGGMCIASANADVSYNTIIGNIASQGNGGGICSHYGDQSTISYNNISGNSATRVVHGADTYGGGIACVDSAVMISNNVLSGNTADKGGAIGCAHLDAKHTVYITSNQITDNKCRTSGAGIYCNSVDSEIINNTISWNDIDATGTGDGISLAGTDATFLLRNNIIAFNSGAGIGCEGSITYTIENNDVFGQDPDDYAGVSPIPGSDISADPLFANPANRDIHISESSPCYNAGINTSVRIGDADLDGEARVMDGIIEIGADEVTGCASYVLTLSPASTQAAVGGTAEICALVTHPVSGDCIGGVHVDFLLDEGEVVSVFPETGDTADDGNVHVTVTNYSQGEVNLTATISACGEYIQDTSQIFFHDPSTPADVVFVIDRSASMVGHDAGCPLEASVQIFVHDICALRSDVRFGAVMFNTGTNTRSVSLFEGVESADEFCTWVYDNGTPDGGTTAQLEALNSALQDLQNNSPASSRHYVVYVTDDQIDSGDKLMLVQNLDAFMSSSGGGVFVSLWENYPTVHTLRDAYGLYFTDDPLYPSLAVNGGFDSVRWDTPDQPLYSFNLLKQRILYGE